MFQDAVLTFYELIRPHLKRKSSLSRFWVGELPKYPDRWWTSVDEARRYCSRAGTAVWSLQKHVQTAASSPNVNSESPVATDGGATPSEWHDRLNLTDMQRVVSVGTENDVLVWVELRANAGLRQLDNWQTQERRSLESGNGFMASETSTSVELEYVPIWKLRQAKRLLAEAADKMNLLSRIEIDHDDGAIVNFDQSRDDVDAEFKNAEYSSSPDI